MDSLIAFESQTEKEKRREERRRERAEILAKAEAEFNKKEKRKKRAELMGEGSWMLPSVEERINNEQKELKKSQSKDKKRHKKEKKNKKKKHHHRSSDSSDSKSPPVWVEKSVTLTEDDLKQKPIGPKMERDSWMTEETPFASFLKPSSNRSKGFMKPKDDTLDEPGQHPLELNPYWKDGGHGLPEIASSVTPAETEHSPTTSKYSSMKFHRPMENEGSREREHSKRSSNTSQHCNWKKKKDFDNSQHSIKEQRLEASYKKVSSSEESEGTNDEAGPGQNEDSGPDEDADDKPLTEEEINKIGAQIIKAELLGDNDLAEQLKRKLDTAQKMKHANPKLKSSQSGATNENVEVLTSIHRSGIARPLPDRQHPVEPSKGRRKRKLETTHEKGGRRTKYFDDDEKYSLKDLVEREKLSTAEDANALFARLAGRNVHGDDEDMDDKMLDKAAKQQSVSLIESRDRQLAIIEHKKMSSSLEKCGFCFENIPKHLIIAVGIKVYLALPKHRSLADGHCFIVPIQHETQGTKCDEDVWDEIKIFRKGLTAMFSDEKRDCVFMETSMNLKRYPHTFIECIPMPKEVGEMAPIYFKKALQECESEWAQNKKIIDLNKKDVRQAVPKGFPYFSVDFGMQGGYAHVIEDEKSFTSYFGREVVGGMLELEATLWRRPHNETFEEQRKKVLKFANQWKAYDWTKQLKST